MPAHVVVGTQWGDEAKAKIVDFLAEDIDAVVRLAAVLDDTEEASAPSE